MEDLVESRDDGPGNGMRAVNDKPKPVRKHSFETINELDNNIQLQRSRESLKSRSHSVSLINEAFAKQLKLIADSEGNVCSEVSDRSSKKKVHIKHDAHGNVDTEIQVMNEWYHDGSDKLLKKPKDAEVGRTKEKTEFCLSENSELSSNSIVREELPISKSKKRKLEKELVSQPNSVEQDKTQAQPSRSEVARNQVASSSEPVNHQPCPTTNCNTKIVTKKKSNLGWLCCSTAATTTAVIAQP